MTDQIPAGLTPDEARAVREWAERARAAEVQDETVVRAARVLLAVLPRPTLADMTANERTECRRMQADVKGYENRAVILQPYLKDGSARVMFETLRVEAVAWENITPRPDLPRLEWPGDQKAALEEAPESEEEFMANIEKALDDHYGPLPSPALPDGWRLADHPEDGRVVVTDDTPGLDGWVYGVFASDTDGTGFDWNPYDPDELTYLDTPAAAPPNTLTVGSKWDNADSLARACEESGRDQIIALDADGYAYTWSWGAEWWEGSARPLAAPYTILHTGREADQ